MKALNKETALKVQRPERIIQLLACIYRLDYLQHERKSRFQQQRRCGSTN